MTGTFYFVFLFLIKDKLRKIKDPELPLPEVLKCLIQSFVKNF